MSATKMKHPEAAAIAVRLPFEEPTVAVDLSLPVRVQAVLDEADAYPDMGDYWLRWDEPARLVYLRRWLAFRTRYQAACREGFADLAPRYEAALREHGVPMPGHEGMRRIHDEALDARMGAAYRVLIRMRWAAPPHLLPLLAREHTLFLQAGEDEMGATYRAAHRVSQWYQQQRPGRCPASDPRFLLNEDDDPDLSIRRAPVAEPEAGRPTSLDEQEDA